MFVRCDVFLFSAVTPVHVGVGRSPGTVDLPVARDSFGVPYVPASSLKGSVKSLCFRARGRVFCEEVYGWDIRFGEVVDTYVSPVVFTDSLLLLYPVRVEANDELVFAYATSGTQLVRAAEVLDLCEVAHGDVRWLRQGIEELGGAGGDDPTGESGVYMNNVFVRAYRRVSKDQLGGLRQAVESLGALPSKLLSGGVYVLSDEDFREVVEAGLVRVTRVALDPVKKTVKEGHLWSEEYVSQGAVFLAATLYRDSVIGAKEARRRHTDLLATDAKWYLVIGGKETVGKGVVRLAPTR